MMKLSLAVLVLCMAACTADMSYEVNTTNTYVEFMTKSLMASKQSNISKDENKLTVMFADLQQVKADNATIAGLNNTLPAAMFTFGSETDETAETNVNITFKRLVGTAPVFEGTFKVNIELFTKGGNIAIDGENTTVMEGDVRVVVEMANMTFADTAATLKLMLNIKGPATPAALTPAGTDGVAYNLGDGGAVRLSKKVMKGADYEAVTPMMSGNDFSFSLPKGSPVKYSFFLKLADAKMADADGDDPSAAAAVTPLLVTWVVAAACKLLF
ncbi:uncharacterized protein LOC124113371 [Haliotis rufescens]|uniref:uncharacterized protein LOC124113371 n=1 Tax=Haliotis rufescens TaxID=6454 RepID=UPI00201F5064|nr:uncharacterized protein LOC124113371 [Haliotis rufescens]